MNITFTKEHHRNSGEDYRVIQNGIINKEVKNDNWRYVGIIDNGVVVNM